MDEPSGYGNAYKKFKLPVNNTKLLRPMPTLFDVPGWSVPSGPVSIQRQSKKRKRAADPEGEELLRNAQANLDKLVDSLGGDTAFSDGTGGGASRQKRKKKATSRPSDRDQHQEGSEGPRPRAKLRNLTKALDHLTVDPPSSSSKVASQNKKAKKKKNAKRVEQPSDTLDYSAATRASGSLTPLQQSLKKGLDGARFRLLNETLYKSSSHEAVKMMKEDPKIFEDYHAGFRSQVQSWPSNPVSHYISELSSYPAKTVIADLGCGDAALARTLLTKNFTVLSFDLISDGVYVTEADICSRVPLPGSEPRSAETTQGEAQVVDVVVCALSLMSTNWPKCISEAWRILRPGGELMIAEVASRFTSVDKFTSLIGAIGFKLQNKDDRNSHFTLFRFKKVARRVISEQEWTGLMSRGCVLKSCDYKRR